MALDYTAATVRSQTGGIATRPNFQDYLEVPGDASYTTGGYSLDSFLEALVEQARSIKNVLGHGTNGTTKVDVRWDAVAGKMVVVSTTTGVQISNATDLSAYTFYLSIFSE
jgi:hypothetical protein